MFVCLCARACVCMGPSISYVHTGRTGCVYRLSLLSTTLGGEESILEVLHELGLFILIQEEQFF